MNQPLQNVWPFNPNFPQAFSFPAFGTDEWLAFACWDAYKGNVAEIPRANKIRAGAKLDWQDIWSYIYAHTSFPPPPGWIPNTTSYSMKLPEGWVLTLLDAERFWFVEINVWALQMMEQEFTETAPDDRRLDSYANFPNIPDSKEKCEHFCRRFHAYQQARYRWHEHLLEKHCDRVLGKRDIKPETALEARACLIGWLSRQRGYARHPLVTSFTRRKPAPEKKRERYFFDKERCAPSSRHYRAKADEMGWLILTWPIWNFRKWKWPHIGEALIRKFRFGDRDHLPTSRRRLKKALHENSDESGSMPAEKALALFYECLGNPTRKEQERHEDWEIAVRSRRGEKAFEKLARLAVGDRLWEQTLGRPQGRGADEKPPLWDFAQRISA